MNLLKVFLFILVNLCLQEFVYLQQGTLQNLDKQDESMKILNEIQPKKRGKHLDNILDWISRVIINSDNRINSYYEHPNFVRPNRHQPLVDKDSAHSNRPHSSSNNEPMRPSRPHSSLEPIRPNHPYTDSDNEPIRPVRPYLPSENEPIRPTRPHKPSNFEEPSPFSDSNNSNNENHNDYNESLPNNDNSPITNPHPGYEPTHTGNHNNEQNICTTPKNEQGQCKLLKDCPIKFVVTDYNNFLKYSCVLGKQLGVCCPKNQCQTDNDCERNQNCRLNSKGFRSCVAQNYECKNGKIRISTNSGYQCVCPAGYFEDSNKGCIEIRPVTTNRPVTSRPTTSRPTTSRPSTPKSNTNKPTTKAPPRRNLLEETKTDCGFSPKTRIVGGKDSKKESWPWAVAIFNTNGFKDQFCGGALITKRHVLTAAHCMVKRKPKDIYVRIGAYNIQEEDENQNAFSVIKISSHAQYNNVTNINDISLLTLDKDVVFSSTDNPICVPNDNEEYTNQNATVIGWGTTSYSGTSSSILQEVTIPVWNTKDCAKNYGSQKITDKQICAGLKKGGKDSCQGDSGGPLMRLSNTRRRWEIIGVVSWGFRCGEPENPGVYTRVNKYYGWIDKEIN